MPLLSYYLYFEDSDEPVKTRCPECQRPVPASEIKAHSGICLSCAEYEYQLLLDSRGDELHDR